VLCWGSDPGVEARVTYCGVTTGCLFGELLLEGELVFQVGETEGAALGYVLSDGGIALDPVVWGDAKLLGELGHPVGGLVPDRYPGVDDDEGVLALGGLGD
jgi:hypothetical protein